MVWGRHVLRFPRKSRIFHHPSRILELVFVRNFEFLTMEVVLKPIHQYMNYSIPYFVLVVLMLFNQELLHRIADSLF